MGQESRAESRGDARLKVLQALNADLLHAFPCSCTLFFWLCQERDTAECAHLPDPPWPEKKPFSSLSHGSRCAASLLMGM